MGAVCPRRADENDGDVGLGCRLDVGVSGDLTSTTDHLPSVPAGPSKSNAVGGGTDAAGRTEDSLELRAKPARTADIDSCTVDSNGRLILIEKPGARCAARDAQGGSHRARKWRGTTGYIGSGGPIDAVRQAQRAWVDEHPEQLLKWSFPTKQRECLKVTFRAAEWTESLTSSEFRTAFGESVQGHSRTVVRTLVFLYLNYLHPHRKRIQAQGRHILMLKGPTMDRTREMAMMPDEGMAELTEARCKVREKRARQKEKHKQRREDDECEDGVTQEEVAMCFNPPPQREGLIQPHASLTTLLRDIAKPRS